MKEGMEEKRTRREKETRQEGEIIIKTQEGTIMQGERHNCN